MIKLKIQPKIAKLTALIMLMLTTTIGLGVFIFGASYLAPIALGFVMTFTAISLSTKKQIGLALATAALTGLAAVYTGQILIIGILLLLSIAIMALADTLTSGAGKIAPMLVAIAGTSHSFGSNGLELFLAITFGAALASLMLLLLKVRIPPRPVMPRQAIINALAVAALALIFAELTLRYDIDHGYWAIITICSVMRPEIGDTFRTVNERIIGTIIGAIAGVVTILLAPQYFIALAIIMSLAITIYMGIANQNKYSVIAATLMLILIFSFNTDASAIQAAETRGLITVLSSLLVGTTALLIWRINDVLTRRQLNKPLG